MLIQFKYAPLTNCPNYHDNDWSAVDGETYQEGDPKGYGSNPLIAHFELIRQTDGQIAAFMQMDQLLAYAEELMKSTPIPASDTPTLSSHAGVGAVGAQAPSVFRGTPAPNPSFSPALEMEAAIKAILGETL